MYAQMVGLTTCFDEFLVDFYKVVIKYLTRSQSNDIILLAPDENKNAPDANAEAFRVNMNN